VVHIRKPSKLSRTEAKRNLVGGKHRLSLPADGIARKIFSSGFDQT
jgi:hypothetical protein